MGGGLTAFTLSRCESNKTCFVHVNKRLLFLLKNTDFFSSRDSRIIERAAQRALRLILVS